MKDAFHFLGEVDIQGYKQVIAEAIKNACEEEEIQTVILAQLCMSVFTFSYPNPKESFGVELLNSGETGFKRVGEVLMNVKKI